MRRDTLTARDIQRILGSISRTQTEVAQLLGVSPGLVSQWKNGHATITPQYAKELARLAKELRATDEEERDSDAEVVSQTYGEWLAEQLETLKVNQATLAAQAEVNPLTVSNLITGKTENPQNFLKKQNPNMQVPKAPMVDHSEPVVGIPYIDDEISQVPSECGVYVIHDARGWPAYVGKENLQRELKNYKDRAWTSSKKVASKFSYAVVGNDEDAQRIETILIKFMADSLLVNEKKRVSVAERV
jgi:plasmid maintenance system antidote protein VapI